MSESKSNETCFLCLDQVIPGKKDGRGRPSSVKVKVSTQGPKILLSYLLNTINSKSVAGTFENDILIAYKSGRLKLCPNCELCSEKITKLHLQLEVHQMKIVDLLKEIQYSLNNSTGIAAHTARNRKLRQENGGLDGVRGGTLLEAFQDRIQRKFLSRRLSDGYEVRLKKLDILKEHLLPSQSCHVDTSLGTVIKEEPAETIDSVDFDSPPTSSPFDHEVNDDDYLQSPTSDFKIPRENPLAKGLRARPKKSRNPAFYNRKRIRSYYQNWAPTKKRKEMRESSLFDELSAEDGMDEVGARRNKKSRVEINYVKVEASESSFSEEGNQKKRDNSVPQEKTHDGDSDLEDEYEPFSDAGDVETDEEYKSRKSNTKRELKKPKKKLVTKPQEQKTRWPCDICLEQIPFKQMQDHLQTHPQFEKFYFCKDRVKVKRSFGTFKGYVWHLLERCSCPSSSSLACDLCADGKTFDKKDLPKHLYEDHKLDHPRPTCPDCFKSFYDLKTFRKHKIIEHERRFICEYCSRGFDNKTSLECHIMKLHLEKKFQCAFCPSRFCSETTVRYHEQKVHAKESLVEADMDSHIKRGHEDRLISCKFCPKKFKKYDLKRHQDAHSGELKYECSHCSYATTTRDSLHCHIRIHGERKYVCDYCNKRFALKRYLDDHVRTHTKEKPFQCDICSMAFVSRDRLSAHRKKKHGVTPQAKRVCDREPASTTDASKTKESDSMASGKLESTRDAMNRHQEGIENKFQCAYCPAVFRKEASVRNHEQKVHIKESLTPCPYCGKEMVEADMDSHIKRAHEDKEKFSCKLCPKQFSTKFDLKRHEDAHSGELKYKCSHCSYATTTRDSLNRHVQIHGERKYVCDYCFKRFTLKRYLNDHVRTHTKEKPFKCGICSMAFTTRNRLSAHRKKKHGVTPQAIRLCDREPASTTGASKTRESESVASGKLGTSVDSENPCEDEALK